MAEDRRAELLRWIEQTRSNQRMLGIASGAGALVGIVLWLWRGDVGGVVLGTIAIVAVCGFWITASHLSEFRAKLEALDRTMPQ